MVHSFVQPKFTVSIKDPILAPERIDYIPDMYELSI